MKWRGIVLLAGLALSLGAILTFTNTQDDVRPDSSRDTGKPPATELRPAALAVQSVPAAERRIRANTPQIQKTQNTSTTAYTVRSKEELARMTNDELFEAFSSASGNSYLELMGECIRRNHDGSMTDEEYSQALYIQAKRESEWGEYSFSGTKLHVSVLRSIEKYDEAVALLEEEIRIVKEGKLKLESYLDGTEVNSWFSRTAVVRDIKKRIKEVREEEKEVKARYRQVALDLSRKGGGGKPVAPLTEEERRILFPMPENEQAIVSLGSFQSLDSDTSDSEENKKVAEAARRKAFKGEYAEAEQLYLSIGNREGAATVVAQEYTASMGDEAARARLCTKVLEQYADTVQGQLVISGEAKEYKSRGDNDKALALLEPLASKVRDDNTALEVAITLAGLYSERGDTAKATDVMEKAYERQINKGGTLNYMTTYMLLQCYWKQQNVPACEKLVKDIMGRMKTPDGELNEIFGPEISAPQQAQVYENFERMLKEKNFRQY